ncbi:MAG: hypothetical protein COU09_01105 [Candidatus Harrisonbacteria bacterium CG10_big_fil_rev_8_21_14_0_10_44_23]|uniref:Uncharacterized protein n=1 Tax=Candidatus Harrisonbacteria bacterium CG10_big_fil_rev_8_21_14_0_10_44_23 TaxID=1974585 RepID=A0A2H0UQE5_9BACT|nr:MAG: hypothetical protein COU09_01105 [Candidatus Harrisonbacteria bacterium CG10_big_fil_rev_8_21_14_0_10_44_23]
MIDIRERVFEVLENTHLMSLAVVDKDGPWVADVVFIYDKDFNIFWMSDPEARHSRAISNSFKAAGSITNSVKSKEPDFGLQFSGGGGASGCTV